jgi:hypothetical protein
MEINTGKYDISKFLETLDYKHANAFNIRFLNSRGNIKLSVGTVDNLSSRRKKMTVEHQQIDADWVKATYRYASLNDRDTF